MTKENKEDLIIADYWWEEEIITSLTKLHGGEYTSMADIILIVKKIIDAELFEFIEPDEQAWRSPTLPALLVL